MKELTYKHFLFINAHVEIKLNFLSFSNPSNYCFSDIVREADNDIEFQKVFARLCDEDIHDLPTGGELYSK